MEYTIDPKQKRVILEGVGIWTWKEPTFGEFKALRMSIERAATVYSVLESARHSFANGLANYAAAAKEIGNLIDESNQAAVELKTAVSASEKWFDGPGSLTDAFDGELDEHLSMIREWFACFEPKPEVLGNSSREHSESSGPVLPTTAKSAKGSGSARKEKSKGRVLGRRKNLSHVPSVHGVGSSRIGEATSGR